MVLSIRFCELHIHEFAFEPFSDNCLRSLTQVLLDGFLMVAIDGSTSDRNSDWFCYHASSHSILPINFCKKNNIPLTVPHGKRE